MDAVHSQPASLNHHWPIADPLLVYRWFIAHHWLMSWWTQWIYLNESQWISRYLLYFGRRKVSFLFHGNFSGKQFLERFGQACNPFSFTLKSANSNGIRPHFAILIIIRWWGVASILLPRPLLLPRSRLQNLWVSQIIITDLRLFRKY